MEWMLMPLKRYAQFNGRSRRKEYWMWVLFVILAYVVLSFIDGMLGLGGGPWAGSSAMSGGSNYGAGISGGLLASLFALATFIPGLAVSVRRLHDVDRSGWWLLLGFIPLIGAIILIIWYCTAGTNGANRFGPDPLDDTPEELSRTFE
jgi:uncharacterized membrane protein YhaH (DUF805 family)